MDYTNQILDLILHDTGEHLTRVQSKKASEEVISLYREYNELTNLDRYLLPLPSQSLEDNDAYVKNTSETFDYKLSIVVTTRNDDHVERMHERTQAFISSLNHLTKRFNKSIELIIVEWNPPKETLSMNDAFNYEHDNKNLDVKIIEVGHDIHTLYKFAEDLPLYQMIAKNVGIRRANGEFILATNIDILLSPDLFEFITSDELSEEVIYRSDRWDIDRNILDTLDPKAQLEEAPHKVFQINVNDQAISDYPIADGVIELPSLKSIWFPNLHTMACGDFQMLHSNSWNKVGGYSELDCYSYHIDSLFAVSCHHAQFKEYIIPFPHYHIDHTLGKQMDSANYEINEKKVIPHIPLHSLFYFHLKQRSHGFMNLNDSNWGLNGIDLPLTLNGQTTSYNHCDEITHSSKLHVEDVQCLIDGDEIEAAFKHTFKNICTFILNRPKPLNVYIWGCGLKASFIREHLNQNNIEVIAHIHGGKQQPKIDTKIIAVEDFEKHVERNALILVASMFYKDILKSLNSYALEEGLDYIVL